MAIRIKTLKDLKDFIAWPPPFSLEVYSEYKIHFNKVAAHVEKLHKYVAEFQKAIKHLMELALELPDSFNKLADYGWFIGFDFDLWQPSSIANKLDIGNIDEVNQFMDIEITKILDEIEEKLIARFPNRKDALKSAFKAHRNEDYYLSILVFLAQTEGMTVELTGYSPFKKVNKKPKVSKYIEDEASKDLTYILLSPLIEESLINTSSIVNSYSENFNRHEIMHGKCTNYGTRVNSLKAISFAYYIGEVLYSNVDELYKFNS